MLAEALVLIYWRTSGLALFSAGRVPSTAVGALLSEHAIAFLVAIRRALVSTPPRVSHQDPVQASYLHLAEV